MYIFPGEVSSVDLLQTWHLQRTYIVRYDRIFIHESKLRTPALRHEGSRVYSRPFLSQIPRVNCEVLNQTFTISSLSRYIVILSFSTVVVFIAFGFFFALETLKYCSSDHDEFACWMDLIFRKQNKNRNSFFVIFTPEPGVVALIWILFLRKKGHIMRKVFTFS